MTVLVLIIWFDISPYNNLLRTNLAKYNIPHHSAHYKDFPDLDLSKYSHFIISGTDKLYVPKSDLALSKEQILGLLATDKPILGSCYGFHLLAYYLSSPKDVKGLKTKHYENMYLSSPLLDPDHAYLMNHDNYVPHLNNQWDVISTRIYRDTDGIDKTIILDAVMKHYPVLGIQYHPEATPSNSEFMKQWVYNQFPGL